MTILRPPSMLLTVALGLGLAAGCDPGFDDTDSSTSVAAPAVAVGSTTASGADSVPETSVPTPSTKPVSEFKQSLRDFKPRDAELLWEQTQPPIGDPVLVDDIVLIYNKGPKLTALDLVTGEERWAVSTSKSDAYFEQASALVVDDIVVTFVPSGGDTEVQVVGLDVETGKQRWVSEPGVFETMPFLCGDGAACVNGSGTATVSQFQPATGERVATWASGQSHLIDDLYTTNEDGGLIVSQDGPAGRGWSFDWQEVSGVEPDTKFGPVAWPSGKKITVMSTQTVSEIFADQTHDAMVAVDTSTGSVLWAQPDATVNCFGVGEPLGDFKTLRCRIAGDLIGVDNGQVNGDTVVYTPSGWSEMTDTFEAFDPQSGEVLGSVVATPVPAWDGEGEWPFHLRYGRIADAAVIQTLDGAVVLDPKTGKTSQVPKGRIAWCSSSPDGGDAVRGFRACDPSTEAWTEPEAKLPPMIPDVGVAKGNLVAFIRDGSLTAYRVARN